MMRNVSPNYTAALDGGPRISSRSIWSIALLDMLYFLLLVSCTCAIGAHAGFINQDSSLPNCSLLEFTCGNGNCINYLQRCNGANDCGDNSDEFSCPACNEGATYCRDDYWCVVPSKLCNAVPDCRDGSDEESCTSCAGGNGFLCSNKRCVSASSRCDGKNDCSDKSDEANCIASSSGTGMVMNQTNAWNTGGGPMVLGGTSATGGNTPQGAGGTQQSLSSIVTVDNDNGSSSRGRREEALEARAASARGDPRGVSQAVLAAMVIGGIVLMASVMGGVLSLCYFIHPRRGKGTDIISPPGTASYRRHHRGTSRHGLLPGRLSPNDIWKNRAHLGRDHHVHSPTPPPSRPRSPLPLASSHPLHLVIPITKPGENCISSKPNNVTPISSLAPQKTFATSPTLPPPPPSPSNLTMTDSMCDTSVSEEIACLLFTLDQLKVATGGFSDCNLLGKGRLGHTYKGVLQDGSAIAVKRLTFREGMRQGRSFIKQVEALGMANNPSLVKLWGCCVEEGERMLVYEHMPNGNLQDFLRRKDDYPRPSTPGGGSDGYCEEGGGDDRASCCPSNVSWLGRVEIALSIAKSLRCLHVLRASGGGGVGGGYCPLIHGALKANNVLVDGNKTIKLVDYGFPWLAVDGYELGVLFRSLHDTEYLSPDYASAGRIDRGSDIFGLGVLILELISGKIAYEKTVPPMEGKRSIVAWAREVLQSDDVGAILDEGIAAAGSFDREAVWRVTECAVMCCESYVANRPTLDTVINELSSVLQGR